MIKHNSLLEHFEDLFPWESPYLIVAICQTIDSISKNISLAIKTGKRYLIQFIAAQFMTNTSNCFHGMIDNNYSLKWRWLVLDIYRTAKQ